MIVTELSDTPLLPRGFKIPTTRYVHPSVRMRQLIETEPYLFGPGVYDPFGKMYDASRLGQEFVEDLPTEKVV